MSRLAIIKKEKCKPDLCGWECKRVCPINMTGSDAVYEDSDKKAGIDEILCTGCGICPKVCPFDAITIINLPELSNKPPIHQYGPNGFRIFDLPLVQEGAITGIIGSPFENPKKAKSHNVNAAKKPLITLNRIPFFG